MPSSPDTFQVLLTRFVFIVWGTASESTVAYLTLSGRRVSYSLRESSSSICLLHCDQLRLDLSHNKYFGLLRRHYGPKGISSQIWLSRIFNCAAFKSNFEEGNAQRVSASTITIVPITVGTLKTVSVNIIYVPQTTTLQNMSKPLTHPRIYIYIYIYIYIFGRRTQLAVIWLL